MNNPWAKIVPPDAAIDISTGEYLFKPDVKTHWLKSELVLAWQNAAAALETAKTEEIDLRNKVVSVFGDPKKDKGTETKELGNGWKLKLTHKLNFKLKSHSEGVSDVDAVSGVIQAIGKIGPEMTMLAPRLVAWKPQLSTREYELLLKTAEQNKDNPEHSAVKAKALLETVVEFNKGAPTVEVVPPKV